MHRKSRCSTLLIRERAFTVVAAFNVTAAREAGRAGLALAVQGGAEVLGRPTDRLLAG